MYTPVSLQELDNARQDVKSLEKVINGNENEDVATRLGETYPSVQKAIRLMTETGIGFTSFETKAQMTASVKADGTYAVVTNDSIASNVGIYLKKSGVWSFVPWNTTRLVSDLRTAFSLNTQYLKNDIFNDKGFIKDEWFVPPNAKYFEVLKAVKSIRLYNADPLKTYRLTVFANNDPSYKDKVIITEDGASTLTTGDVAVVKNPSGTTKVEIYSTAAKDKNLLYAVLDIDYSVLSTGTLIATSSSPIVIKTNQEDIDSQAVSDVVEARNIVKNLNTDYIVGDILNEKGLIDTKWQTPSSAKYFDILKAVKSINIDNANPDKIYKLTVFANNDVSYKDKITITEDGVSILDYGSNNVNKSASGLTTVSIGSASLVDNRSLTATLIIDYSMLPAGTLLATSSSAITIKTNIRKKDIETTIPPAAKRISMAGSSITWGSGYLATQSYLSVVERYLRDVVATTIHINDLAPNDYLLSGENWYKGNARRLNGAGKYVEFDIYGDELSICYGLERGNNNSALIDVIIDGQLYDTFDTSNTLPSGTKTENFTGDGSTVKFNLTTAHSYAHTVKVNGVTKSGSMNVGGSGASVTQDYLVVRSYDNNSEQVVHTVWFKVAPPSGASVTVDFSYGESISYTKWTVGNTGRGFTAPLESQYGDGATSYSTTEPANVSSGLGFRQTDERSVKTYRFDNVKIRHVKLLVKAISPLAVATTPFFDLNFVTNRMHHLQNAGIGGWTAQLFLDSSVKVNRADYVARFNPDIFLLESATNDDWNAHVATATVTRTMTDADILKADTSLYYSAISGNTVTDERVNIVAITSTTIKLESAVNDASINVGDAITIGSYGGDHRRIATRTVKSYDTSNKTVTLNRMIDADDFRQITALSELVGSFVLIKNAPTWANSVEQVCSVVLDGNPDCKVYLATAGIPNYYHRRLFGYRELAKQLVLKNGYAGFADFYKATFDFQYNQAPKKSISFTATSSKRYKVSLGGRVPCVLSVTVAGVQRTDYKITGGYGYQWDVTSNPTLANDVLKIRDFYIEFDNAVSGSVVVNYTSDLWSADYTHPLNINGLTDGVGIIGREVANVIANQLTP